MPGTQFPPPLVRPQKKGTLVDIDKGKEVEVGSNDRGKKKVESSKGWKRGRERGWDERK